MHLCHSWWKRKEFISISRNVLHYSFWSPTPSNNIFSAINERKAGPLFDFLRNPTTLLGAPISHHLEKALSWRRSQETQVLIPWLSLSTSVTLGRSCPFLCPLHTCKMLNLNRTIFMILPTPRFCGCLLIEWFYCSPDSLFSLFVFPQAQGESIPRTQFIHQLEATNKGSWNLWPGESVRMERISTLDAISFIPH